MEEIRMIAAHGALGAGVDADSLDAALDLGPQFIACDAGTTDAGPFYLGSGQAAFPAEAVRRDLVTMIAAGRRAGVPVIVGSVGTAGADAQVAATLDLVADNAAERGEILRVAAIYTEQDLEYLVGMLAAGRITALEPAPEITPESIRRSAHVVAMIGVEPLQAALAEEVDVVVAGRCSDAALFAALPIAQGFDEGLAWHVGKILECGPMAMVSPGPGVMVGSIDHAGATIRAIGPGAQVSALSVAAHSLYENASPYLFPESSGTFDLTDATYESIDDGSVRITGSTFHPAPSSSVKLEGAELVGYSSIIVGGVRDPLIIGQLDRWLEGVRARIDTMVHTLIGDRVPSDGYQLVIHQYGRNAVMAGAEPDPHVVPHEVGLVVDILAPTQELASLIAQISRQPLLHHPIPEWDGGVTTFACLHNPAHIDRGPVYQFNLHHILRPELLDDVYRLEIVALGAGVRVGALR
jgi:hypothetical protein